MNPVLIVHRLLEADEPEEDPRLFLRKAMASERRKVARRLAPPAYRELFKHAPAEFKAALTDHSLTARWAPSEDYVGDLEWWPSEDDGIWTQYSYYVEFQIEEGTLHLAVLSLDRDGNRDVADEADYSPSELKRLRQNFSYSQWLRQTMEYEEWVIANGEDPLAHFYVHPPERRTVRWTFTVVRDGEGVRFVEARRPGKVITRPERLPEEVRDYLGLVGPNPEGPMMRHVWDELIAVNFAALGNEAQIEGDTLKVTHEMEMAPGPAERRRIEREATAELQRLATQSLERHRQAYAAADPNYSTVVP